MRFCISLVVAVVLSIFCVQAQTPAGAWQKALEKEVCDCVNSEIEANVKADEAQVKAYLISCFKKYSEKYQQNIIATSSSGKITPQQVIKEIGQSVNETCLNKPERKLSTAAKGKEKASDMVNKIQNKIEEGKQAIVQLVENLWE